jgi:NAD(P)-dependent dehydrogenase (short-subunit alcohol dehydrogenase family)
MPNHDATVAVITGGTQGLGRAAAEALLAEGCRRMVLVGRDDDKGARAIAEMTDQADVIFCAADLADLAQVQGVMDVALARFGRITALVNAAATTARGSILDTTPLVWDQHLNTNARAPFFLLQRFALAAISGGHMASAVNITSMAAHGGPDYLAPYAASKAALANITHNAAAALKPHHIRVNAINCGRIDTESAIQTPPFGQLVQPTHVAALVSYMLSPDSGVMTGSVVDFDQNVNGAMTP